MSKILFGAIGALTLAALGLGAAAIAQPAPEHPGKAVYQQFCAACHENPDTKSPTLAALKTMSDESLRLALTVGKMRQQGAALSSEQLDDVVKYLADTSNSGDAWIASNMCAADKRNVDLSGPETMTRFGIDYQNHRRLTAAQAKLTTQDLSNLEVAWAIGMPQTSGMRSAPVIVGSTIFYSASQAGHVLALDTKTGCVKWAYKSPVAMRTSMSYGAIGRAKALVVGDAAGQIQAIDAKTGKLIWSAEGRHEPNAMLTGAPVIWRDRVIVPVSALDVARAAAPTYECCKSHGAVVALKASDGSKLWVAHTMEDAKPTGQKNSAGANLWGPSGAAVWSSPAVDEKRGVIYVGTGQNTSLPATKTSDSIWAIDAKTGKTKWFFQALERDVFTMACPRGANCPSPQDSALKDFDFGAAVIVAKDAKGKDILLGGQKSADVWGLTPDGKVVWNRKLGAGSALGGVHWGMASDGKTVYVPIADRAGAGMHAVDIATGEVRWSHKTTPDCENGRQERVPYCVRGFAMSAAPMVVDGAVLAATLDGRLMIFDGKDGKLIGSHDTIREFKTLNGVAGKGGSIDSHSIAAGDGMVFVGSGYPTFGAPPGNVLIAYRPKK